MKKVCFQIHKCDTLKKKKKKVMNQKINSISLAKNLKESNNQTKCLKKEMKKVRCPEVVSTLYLWI